MRSERSPEPTWPRRSAARSESRFCFSASFPATSSRYKRFVAQAMMVVAVGGSAAAHADIWGYVDEAGRSHVATEKLDDRYTLFFKGGVRVDQAHPHPTAFVGVQQDAVRAHADMAIADPTHPGRAIRRRLRFRHEQEVVAETVRLGDPHQ